MIGKTAKEPVKISARLPAVASCEGWNFLVYPEFIEGERGPQTFLRMDMKRDKVYISLELYFLVYGYVICIS